MLRILAILTSVLACLLLGTIFVINALQEDELDAPQNANEVIVPERFDPTALDSANRASDIGEIGGSGRGWTQVEDDSGRVTREFRWSQMTPREDFEFDVVDPETLVYLSPQRVVYITAAQGRIYAPDDQPQRGSFSGGVRVKFYETEEDRPADLSDTSRDLLMTLDLDDALFNTQTGNISSSGRITLHARYARFFGQGLKIEFNEPRQRIEYLEITHGQHITFTPVQQAEESTEPTSSQASDNNADPSDPAQFYRAEFERAIRVESSGRSIEADKVIGLFAFKTNASPAVSAAAEESDTATTSSSQSQQTQDPITMTWQGKLVMRPVEKRPAVMRADRDFLLAFTGQPVVLRSDRDETITCANVTYLDSTKRIRLTGSEAHPLAIDAPRLGIIETDIVEVRQLAGRDIASLIGPGRISATETGDDQTGGLPEGFAVKWSERVDLELASTDGEVTVRSADFWGDVRIDDRKLLMEGDRLQLEFLPQPDSDDVWIDRVIASGDVRVTSERGKIAGSLLDLKLIEGEHPSELRGHDVVLTDAFDRTIASQKLAATFAAPETDNAGNTSVDLAAAIAEGRVALTMRDGTTVHGHKMDVDATQRQAVITGKDGAPIRVTQNNAVLTVPSLTVNQFGQGDAIYERAVARGGGTFVLDEPADEQHPEGRRVLVRWDDSLFFAGDTMTLDLTGNVSAESQDRSNQVNTLTAQRVQLELTEAAEGADQDDELSALRRMIATDDVVLLSTTWFDADRKRVASRLRIGGKTLEFDNATEMARVPGQGTMLLEDYRPTDANKQRGSAALSGRGATLFTWTGGMAMDGSNTRLAMTGDVKMTHRPAGDQAVVEMQTDRLSASLQHIGGIQALRTSEIESLDIDTITAVGNTRLSDAQRQITCDRLAYDGPSQTAHLEATGGNRVNVIDRDNPTPLTARKVRWMLERDRFEIDDAGN